MKKIIKVLVLSALLVSCRTVPQAESSTVEKKSWPEVYTAAVADASNPEPGEIYTNLVSITPENPSLTWKDIDGVPHVLMVSLTSSTSYYEGSVGQLYNTGNYYTWVTSAPEVQNTLKGKGLEGDALKQRLRELLGLTPDATVTAFIEFWVNPASLFRPAADNEVNDSEAGLNFPENTEGWYRQWFNDLRASQYFQSEVPSHNAYPWTQLGYTYDWGSEQSEIGMSEFVIKANSQVYIESINDIDAYINN